MSQAKRLLNVISINFIENYGNFDVSGRQLCRKNNFRSFNLIGIIPVLWLHKNNYEKVWTANTGGSYEGDDSQN